MKRISKWLGAISVLAVIVLAAVAYTPDTDPVAMRAKHGGPTSRFIDLGGGLTVHVRDEGPREAPVIVLLHGANASLHTWDEWTGLLTPRFRVIRFDQIGHGLTGPSPTRNYGANAFADTIERLTNKLGVEKFVLAGSSMGGWVAWQYALRHQERLNGLVLIDASGAPETQRRLPLVFRLAQNPAVRPLLLHFTPRALVASGMKSGVSDETIITDAAIDRTWNLLRYPGNRQATIDRQSLPRQSGKREDIARIATPTLILWGTEDKLVPVSSAGWFADALPNDRTVIYPGIGHIPMEEVPKQSANDLQNWLATLPALR